VLVPGELSIQKNGQSVLLAISGGMLEVRRGGEVYILADTAERAEHIDIERAEQARARAEVLMREQKDATDIEFARLQIKLEKELNRLRVGRKSRHLQMR
jgi:F-type H+-transporting ATPase subunit epsilon